MVTRDFSGEDIVKVLCNDIAEDAGAKEFDEFCKWIDRNR